ncbi:PepSY domain-containing protein [Chitinophaga sedimenti]|nr:PepSY domain-containing protein [Chitinophaga sedimenti]
MYKHETTGMKVRRLVLPVHSGSIYGWPTKIVAFAGCLFAVSLPVTGFLVWWNRKKKKPKGAVQEVKASADGSVVVG